MKKVQFCVKVPVKTKHLKREGNNQETCAIAKSGPKLFPKFAAKADLGKRRFQLRCFASRALLGTFIFSLETGNLHTAGKIIETVKMGQEYMCGWLCTSTDIVSCFFVRGGSKCIEGGRVNMLELVLSLYDRGTSSQEKAAT